MVVFWRKPFPDNGLAQRHSTAEPQPEMGSGKWQIHVVHSDE
jgi:hypothetical protein